MSYLTEEDEQVLIIAKHVGGGISTGSGLRLLILLLADIREELKTIRQSRND